MAVMHVVVLVLVVAMIRDHGLPIACGVKSKHQAGIHNAAADGQGFSSGPQLRGEVLPHGLELIRLETVATTDQYQIG